MIKAVMVVAAMGEVVVATAVVAEVVVVVVAASEVDVVVAAEVAGAVNPQIGTAIPMLKNSVNSSLVDCLQIQQKTQ